MAEAADLFEIIRSTRSMRRLKPDAVPVALLNQVLEAGTCAASGGNQQNWRFLVIRDAAIKAAAGALYRRGWHEVVGPRYRAGGSAPCSCNMSTSATSSLHASGRNPPARR